MSHRFLPAIVITALLFAFAGEANAQTVANGHHLDNTEVGFYGFCVDIPMDYEPFTPDTTKGARLKTFAQATWFGATQLDRHAGLTTKEIIPFKAPNRGLVVVVSSCSTQFPPVKMEKEYLRTLDIFTSWVIKTSKDDFVRDVRKIRNVYVGRVALAAKNGNVTAVNMVMIPPATLLTFYGGSSAEEKDNLLADLDAAVATLNIGKKGPH